MADVYSVGYTAYVNNKFVPRNRWGASVLHYFEEYEAINLAVSSTVYMFVPLKGHRYKGWGQLSWDDLSDTAAYTISVGIQDVAVDCLLAATSVVAAADKADLDAGAAAVVYQGYEFDGVKAVTLTTAGAATDASGTIKLGIDCFGN